MKEKIEVPFSRNKLIKGILGSVLFVIIGFVFLFNANFFYDFPFGILKNPIIIQGVGIISIVFFGTIVFLKIRKLSNDKMGLIIDSTGITDNSNAASIGLIEWNDISEINTKQVMLTKFLMIHLKNPKRYIEKAKSSTKKKLMRSNLKIGGTPISITSSTLQYSFSRIENLIKTAYKQNKNSK